jgi:hypothetical protein
MTDPVPAVIEVRPLHDFVVRLRFSDGVIGDVDLGPHPWGPVFEPLRADRALFARVRVDPDARTIVWPNGADLAPETLHRMAAQRRAG